MRIRNQKAKNKDVLSLITLLEKKIYPKYGVTRNLTKTYIHDNPKNKYYKQLDKLICYLYELRGTNKNPIIDMAEDFFYSVFDYYERFGRVPYLTQLGANASNIIRFDEWMHDYSINSGEEYLLKSIVRYEIFEVPVEVMDIDVKIIGV